MTQLSIFFGDNIAIGEQLTADIKQINDFRTRCDVAIGKRLIEGKRLIAEAHPGFEKTAAKHYTDWANQEFGITQRMASRLEEVAAYWGGDDEDLVDKFTVGALYEIARSKNPEVKAIALEQAAAGESINKNNVVEFRGRVEPQQQEAITVKSRDTNGVDIMALKLEYYEARVAWMTDLLKDLFNVGKITQAHLDVAAANSLWDEEDLEATEEDYVYAISA